MPGKKERKLGTGRSVLAERTREPSSASLLARWPSLWRGSLMLALAGWLGLFCGVRASGAPAPQGVSGGVVSELVRPRAGDARLVIAEVRRRLETNRDARVLALTIDPVYDGDDGEYLVNADLEVHGVHASVGVFVTVHHDAKGGPEIGSVEYLD